MEDDRKDVQNSAHSPAAYTQDDSEDVAYTPHSPTTAPPDGIPVPRNIEEVTEFWISSISGLEIQPNTFKVNPNAYPGVGFLSTIVRVQLEDPRQRFLVKLLPTVSDSESEKLCEVIRSEGLDAREVFFYQVLLAWLVQVRPDFGYYLAPCLYAKVQKEPEHASVLVFRDLTTLGYSMPGFDQGLSSIQLLQALDFVAKLHSTGRILASNIGSPLHEVYAVLKNWHIPESPNNFQSYQSLTWFPLGLTQTDQLLSEFSKHQKMEEIRKAYADLVPHTETILEAVIKAGSQFPTIIHDDLWPHNILVHDSSVIKILDWQLASYADPTFDLSVLLLSSLDLESLNEEGLTKVLMCYFYQYARLLWESGSNVEVERSFDEFKEFFYTFGLAYALIWFAMSADSIYSTVKYRPKLCRIFEFLYEINVVSFLQGLVPVAGEAVE